MNLSVDTLAITNCTTHLNRDHGITVRENKDDSLSLNLLFTSTFLKKFSKQPQA